LAFPAQPGWPHSHLVFEFAASHAALQNWLPAAALQVQGGWAHFIETMIFPPVAGLVTRSSFIIERGSTPGSRFLDAHIFEI
jgi:hypothetical protein